jgi:hypothetical protein
MIASSPRRASAAEAASSKLPPAGLDLAVVALGQFRRDVAQRVHGAALLIGGGPQLPDRLPQAGRPVGDDQRRRAQPAGDEVAPEAQPALVALAAAEGEPEQDLAALERHAPGDEHALGRFVVGVQLQVDRVEEAGDDVVL